MVVKNHRKRVIYPSGKEQLNCIFQAVNSKIVETLNRNFFMKKYLDCDTQLIPDRNGRENP